MLNYWFLYRADGTIYGAPYLGNADEWTNIPPECSGVLGPFDVASASEAVQDAYAHPERYLVQNGQLVEQP
uniref:hypothetical protein n=1 Tax=Alicyclobacillus suci TaxID=2816080 RepID=UPI001A8F9721